MTRPGKASAAGAPGAVEGGAGTGRRPRKAEAGQTVYRAPALDKGLQIVELLADKVRPMAMPEIAQALGRSKTEIYRMLMVLEGHGYIERGEHDDRYSITSRLFELGMRNAPKRNLHDAALPLMHELAEHTQQSCHLGMIAGDQVVIVARVESPAAIGFAVRLGHRIASLDSASGRVIFGTQPREKQAAWLRSLRGRAPNKAALDKFATESRATAARGYLLEPSRICDGIQDIGAPVFDGEALGAVASLTVPYVAHRYATAPLEEVIERTVAAAEAISNSLRLG
jgi:DNA-binding IclR family transcriptional regulator